MAIAAGIFTETFKDATDGTIALDMGVETHKGALFTDTLTSDFDADTAYAVAPYDANETSGGSWSAGGIALTGTTWVDTSEVDHLTLDATDVSVGTTTLAAAMGYLLYADALAGNDVICMADFGTAVTTTNGTITITWTAAASGGVMNFDMTP